MSSTTTLALTPTKRKRDQYPIRMLASGSKPTGASQQVARGPTSTPKPLEPTHQELFSWTLTKEATARCHIRDVHQLQENWKGRGDTHDLKAEQTVVGSQDFYWLGRVPCRNVRIVGVVVGVSQYESRDIYIIDDGTGVIECSKRSKAIQRMPEPGKPPPLYPEYPPASANVGDCVCVVGKASKLKSDWQVVVDTIERTLSRNDELKHYLEVLKLHQTHYGLTEPFSIPISYKSAPQPQPPPRSEPAPASAPSTPPRTHGQHEPASRTSNYTAQSSPVTVIESSPVKPEAPPATSTKLRHPSRLHHAELTRNTFRIYVKYFMDSNLAPQETNDLDSLHDPSFASTPTKRSLDTTPKPTLGRQSISRPKIDRIDFTRFLSSSPPSAEPAHPPPVKGYSISYLRRVPELALLANRVAKQEIRAARKIEKEKEAKEKLTKKAASTSSSKSAATAKARQPTAKDVKKLFLRAVNDLYREGSIVIWDCPSHDCDNLALSNTSFLWKTSTSGMTTANSTAATSVSQSSSTNKDDAGDLSDPDPHEDVYLSVTPAFLADRLEAIIPVVQKNERTSSSSRNGPAQPYRGASSEGLLRYLKADDRWTFLHIDSVEDALKYLEAEGRAWMSGKGQWQLTV